MRRLRAANPERYRATGARYRARHPKRVVAQGVRYRKQNREAHNARSRRYHHANKEKQNARRRAYSKLRDEAAIARKRRADDVDRARALQRAYRAANRDRIAEHDKVKQAQRRATEGRFTRADLRNLWSMQAGLCFWCHEGLDDYHVDHVRPLSRGGTNWPDNIVLACPWCNNHKHNLMPDVWLRRMTMLRRRSAADRESSTCRGTESVRL